MAEEEAPALERVVKRGTHYPEIRAVGSLVAGRRRASKADKLRKLQNVTALTAVKTVFEFLQTDDDGVHSMIAWAKENPTEFYRLYGKLIPAAISGEDGGNIVIQLKPPP